VNKIKYITREEIARRLDISTNSIRCLCRRGSIPEPVVKFANHFYYDREALEIYIKTRLEQKQSLIERGYVPKSKEETPSKDVWNVRGKKGSKFVYSGRTLMHILFCQPALRNGQYTYEDCFK
jgi:hypothetical protein